MKEEKEEVPETRCYSRGTIYPNFEEMRKAQIYFLQTPVNEQSIESMCRDLIEDVKANLLIARMDQRYTNYDLGQVLSEALGFILKNIGKRNEK